MTMYDSVSRHTVYLCVQCASEYSVSLCIGNPFQGRVVKSLGRHTYDAYPVYAGGVCMSCVIA